MLRTNLLLQSHASRVLKTFDRMIMFIDDPQQLERVAESAAREHFKSRCLGFSGDKFHVRARVECSTSVSSRGNDREKRWEEEETRRKYETCLLRSPQRMKFSLHFLVLASSLGSSASVPARVSIARYEKQHAYG